jgi:hypothetical protein
MRRAFLLPTPGQAYLPLEFADAAYRYGHSQIVTEVLLGLLRADPHSYLIADPSWTPTVPSRNGTSFSLTDLLAFAADQQAASR